MGALATVLAAPFKLYNSVSDEIAKDRRLRLSDGASWSQFFGRESTAGKSVTMESALQLSTAWACVKLLAQALSCMPISVYEKKGDDSREKVDDAIADVISDSPNEDQTSLEYWETVVAWLLTHGNSYSERVYSGRNLSSLQPIASTHCTPFRRPSGELVFRVIDRGKTEELPRDKIFHIKGFGQGLTNLDMGLSPIAYGANSLGAAMAADETASKTFANGLRPTGILTVDQVLKPEQRAQLKKNIVDPMAGSANAGGIFTLEAGMKYQPITLNPEDAQMLETRRFGVEEICRWFGVPPIVIGHAAEGQTMWGSGVEQILISWLTLGIDPLADRIEARIKKQLIRPTGNRRRYAEFNREALLQMDSTAKANFLSSMSQNGLMTRNEGRAKLNLPRKDGGDDLTAQTNLAPLDKLGEATDGNSARAAMLSWLGIKNEGKRDEQA